MRRTSVTLSVVFTLIAVCKTPADDVTIDQVFVKLIEQVDIPARKTGVLRSLSVREGSSVKIGQEVGRLDDQQASIELQHAIKEFEVAKHRANDLSDIELAQTSLEHERQAIAQIELDNRILHREAENQFKIEASKKSREVAKNELDRAQRARAEFAGSVSESEIDGLKLSYDQADLESKQSGFESEQSSLRAESSDESIRLQKLVIAQAEVAVQQAQSAQHLNNLTAQLQQTQLDSARLDLEHHRIEAPIDGVVVEILRHKGEWVKPGDPVLRVLRLNRLKVEGYVPISEMTSTLAGQNVVISVNGLNGESIELKGKVVFVSPEVDAVNKEIAVWAEFENSDLRVRPGMQGTMTIIIPSKLNP